MPPSTIAEQAWSRHRTRQQPKSELFNLTSELFQAYRENQTIDLRNRIAELNDRLAIRIAQRCQANCNLPLDDLIQLSRIGLIAAIKAFDPARGAAFSSFAVPYCRGEIQHYLRDHKNLVKAPRRWQEASDSARAVQRAAAANGREISLDHAATCGLGLTQLKWQAIDQATQSQPICSIDEDETLQIAAESSQSIEEQEENEAIKAAIQKQLDKLPVLIRECILERYWAELNDEIIAKRHSISVVKVKALIDEGLLKLREVACCAYN